MLAREWFKPGMPVKEFLLGVYEWTYDTEAISITNARIEMLDEIEDPKWYLPRVYALLEYPLTNPHNLACTNRVKDRDRKEFPDCNYPTLAELQQDAKAMTEAYFAWAADPKQAEKDLERRAKEQVKYDKEDAEFVKAHPECLDD